MRAGASPAISGVPPADLTPRVRSAFEALVTEINALRRQLDAAHGRIAELETLADADPLCPVGNRRYFLREMSKAMAMRDRHRVPAALLFVDVDGLKQVNDAHGHSAGDAALIHVAAALKDSLRQADILARLGGDEFGVLLLHTDAAGARAKAEKLADAVAGRPVASSDEGFRVTVSIGVYPLAADDDPLAMLARADAAMYTEKRTRNAA